MIGVILLVAVVVSLVVLISLIVFNIGSDVSDSPDSSVDFSQTSDGVSVQVISNNNVEEFKVLFPDDTEKTLSSDVGSSLNLIGPEGTYSLVAVLPDGTEEVISTQNIDNLDYSGVFIVLQDEEEEEVEATLSQEFDNIEDYDLELEENDDGDEEVTLQSFEYESGHTLLSDQLLTEDETLTQGERISLMRITSNTDVDTVNMNSFDGEDEVESDVSYVGETIQVHELTNLCPGDELILTESETNNDLASEEIIVDNDCDDLRKVMRYLNGEITAAELINLWNLESDYSIFAYDGQPQPELPNDPVPIDEDDGVKVTFEVIDKDTEEAIPNANVVFGDEIKPTNSTGEVVFENIDPGVEGLTDSDTEGNVIDATAYKEGYKPHPVIPVPEDDWENEDEDEEEEEDFVYRQELELIEFESQPPEQESSTIQPGSGEVYEFEESYSSGGGASISGGFSGGSGGFNTGSGGFNTISGGGGFYSSGGSSPSTFSSSSPIQSEFIQPERAFNVLPLDDSLIPTNEEFEVRTTVAANDEDVSDTVDVYAIESSDSDADFNEDTKIGSSNVNIPSGETTVNSQRLDIDKVGEYTIYVSLGDVDNYKVAGSLDVFDEARQDATIEGGTITPTNANTEDTVEVKITEDDIDFNGANTVTVDIVKNGIKVEEGEIDSDGGEVTYEESFNNPQYVEFHGGIQESQDIALFGTTVITGDPTTTEDTGVTEFDTEIEFDTINEYDCDIGTRTSGQFDCEVETNNDTHELWFDATEKSAYNFDDIDTSSIDRLEFEWVIGNEDSKNVEYTGSQLDRFIDNGHTDEEFIDDFKFNNEDDGHVFTEDTVHMVELRAELDIDGQEYGSTDALFVNALDEPGQDSTRIRGTDVTDENRVTVNLKNDQETVTDDIELQFYEGHDMVNDIENENLLRTKSVSVGPEESKNVGTTFSLEDILEFKDVDDFEEKDDIPITIKLDNIEDEENDYFDETNLTGPDTNELNIKLDDIEIEEGIRFDYAMNIDDNIDTDELTVDWEFSGLDEEEFEDAGTVLEDLIYDEQGTINVHVEAQEDNRISILNSEIEIVEPEETSTINDAAPNCSDVTYVGSGTEEEPYEIEDDYHLQCIDEQGLSNNYKLVQNIDAGGTEDWNDGAGFKSIGQASGDNKNAFTGTIDGQGYEIRNLYMNIQDVSQHGNGLIAELSSGEVKNILIRNADMTASRHFGTFVGEHSGGTLEQVHLRDSYAELPEDWNPDSSNEFGGVVGFNTGGTIIDSSVKNTEVRNPTGDDSGAFVGDHNSNGGEVINSFAQNVIIECDFSCGALVGEIDGDNVVRNSYAVDSTVIANDKQGGGLIGNLDSGSVTVDKTFAAGIELQEQAEGAIFPNDSESSTETSNSYFEEGIEENDASDATELTTEEMTGDDSLDNMSGLNDDHFVTTEVFPEFDWESNLTEDETGV